MKKSILNFGKALNKTEQKSINGGITNTCGNFGLGSYYVNSCSECVNTLLPGAPATCVRNCCIQAY